MDLGELYRRFLKNAGMIIGSRVIFGLLNLGTNVLVARAFGLGELGVVLLLQSYARLFSEIVKFQSWQAVLRFGAILEEKADWPGFRRLIGFTLSIDLVSFAIAIGGAIAFIPWAQDWFDWPPEVAALAPLYMLSIIFITHATPNGVLRLFDRVDVVALQFASNAVLRFLGVVIAWAMGGGVLEIVIAWFVASVLSGVFVYTATIAELRRRRLMPRLTLRWRRDAAEFPGVWRYLWMSNLASAAPLVVNYGTVLVVGAQLGAASAAIFDIARQFAAALSRPTRLLGPLLFPEFSRLAARDDWVSIRRILKKQLALTGMALAVFAAVLFAVLPFAVEFLFGRELVDEIWLFNLLIAGSLLRVLGFALEPAFLSANKAGTLLVIQLIATAVFVAIALPLLGPMGLVAIGLGMLGFHVVYFALFMVIGRRLLKKRIRRSRAAEAAAQREAEAHAELVEERPGLV